MKSVRSMPDGIEGSIDGLLVARRLAQFCPTSLSMDDFNENIINKSKVEYIPPSPSVKIESNEPSSFKLGVASPKHRFAFLINDIKPIEQTKANHNVRMKYELPNVLNVNTPIKSIKPLKIVSFSSNGETPGFMANLTSPTQARGIEL